MHFIIELKKKDFILEFFKDNCREHLNKKILVQCRIQDFPSWRARTLQGWCASILVDNIFAENCVKLKEIGLRREGGTLPDATYLKLAATFFFVFFVDLQTSRSV